MGRRKRDWYPGGFYHVVMRGNNRQGIFTDSTDIQEYHRILTDVYYKHLFEIHAYCVMTNHVHLLLHSPHVNISVIMRHINKRYSDYYRDRYDYTGQIYENRYYSKDVTSIQALLHTSAYIHLNPIETTYPMAQKLEMYPYSTYPSYFGNQLSPQPYIHLEMLPGLLNKMNNPDGLSYAKWCLSRKEEK
ncbi:hypothetical protein GCM10028778_12390 [Barrientosiimonas marina]|uniref:Transposase n=1 Tax=Lentibacillus kimchii TaxID=1542911 RepID=A0ABW2UV24_9BACI